MLLLLEPELAQFAQSLRRGDDPVRGAVRRALSDPPSRPAVAASTGWRLIPTRWASGRSSEPADLGFLRGPHLPDRVDAVLVHRHRARSRRGARPGDEAALAGLLRAFRARLARARRRHWARWRQAYRITAAIAVPLVVSVHSEISLLFAAGPMPGWNSTVFPPYFVLGAAFSGFAVVSMIAVVLRTLLGPAEPGDRAPSRPARAG